MNAHLTEIELQQCVFHKEKCESKIIEHVQLCEKCKAKFELYKILFSEIRSIEKPIFDFNLSKLVMAKLPETKSRLSFSMLLSHFIIFIFIASIFFSFFLLLEHSSEMFNNMLPSFLYLVIISAAIIVSFQVFEIYNRFRNKINMLNFY